MANYNPLQVPAADPMKLPQAIDDFYTVLENGSILLDVLANDRGGNAKSLYSLNQGAPTPAVLTATLASGATVTIVNGVVRLDTAGAYDWLAAGQTTTETFTYAIRLGNGAVSSAEVILNVIGTNDAATIAGAASGSVTEDETPSAAGALAVIDADAGEARFQVPASLIGSYGTFTFDAHSGAWTYTLDNDAAHVQALGAAEIVQDALVVTSYDGTTSTTIEVTVHGADEVVATPPLYRFVTGTADDYNEVLLDVMPASFAGSDVAVDWGNGDVDVFTAVDASATYRGQTHYAPGLAVTGTISVLDGTTVLASATFSVQTAPQAAPLARASIGDDEAQANGSSLAGSISGDGRYVAFYSGASNLVADDVNDAFDIFVRDTTLGTTMLASAHSDGTQSNGFSGLPAICADGRYVAFQSTSSNLVTSDGNGALTDVFLRDLQSGTTTLVSAGFGGFAANHASDSAAISADGRYVAFLSSASNLVVGDDNGFVADVFVRDTVAGTTTLASVGVGGAPANGSNAFRPSISADGRYVAFFSNASNLVVGDGNGSEGDIFVRDLVAGTTMLVSAGVGGAAANNASFDPAISGDGRYVAFRSMATNLVSDDANGTTADIFVRDLLTGTTALATVGSGGVPANADSYAPSISADGRYVTFFSFATNLVADDANGTTADVFVRDMVAGTTTLISGGIGAPSGSDSFNPSISADGSHVAFGSFAANLVAGDTNGANDVFVYDRFASGSTLSGDAGADVLVGQDGVDALAGAGGDDRLTGGGGADVLAGGSGADLLTGGAGADRFVYAAIDEGLDTISDFSLADGDAIDVRDILAGSGITAGTVGDFVGLTADVSGTVVSVSADGGPDFTSLVLLQGVFALSLQSLVDNGGLAYL